MAKIRRSRRHYRMPATRDEVPDVTVTPRYAWSSEKGRYPMTQEEVNQQFASYPSMEEIVADQWDNVRRDRNNRLNTCDWTACRAFDQGNSPDEDWQIYRQLLRDIPQAFAETPWDIDWPIAPDGTGGDDGDGHAMDDQGNVIYNDDEDDGGGD